MKIAALFALALLVVAGCMTPGLRAESPLQAPSPLPTPLRVWLPLAEGGGWTRHCWALDTGADWRASVAMLALGAPAGSNLVQVQGGGLVFVPPAARPDVGEE